MSLFVTRVNQVVPNRQLTSGNPPKPAILQVSLGTGPENGPLDFDISVSAAIQLREALEATLKAIGSR